VSLALSIPLGTVYSRLGQARAILRRALARQKRKDGNESTAMGGKA
jgi:DNA-directed RNA polymerase specialized sigma24 family protein